MSSHQSYDLAVIGGGSGGFGAALAAARRGLRVLVIEPAPVLGGVSTFGGVNTWEPGVGAPAMAAELYAHLARTPWAIGVSRTVKFWTGDQPWGMSHIDRTLAYESTTARAGVSSERLTRATFEPTAMAAAMAEFLTATGRVDIRLGSRFVAAEVDGDVITTLVISTAGREERVCARYVADATAQIRVCSALGCQTSLGAEARDCYGEPSAPAEKKEQLNGVTLCFRVTPVATPAVEPLPAGDPEEMPAGSFSITQYPCGDLNMNTLPTMDGWEYHRLGEEEGRRVCLRRLRHTWHWLQREKGFDRYRLAMVFPYIGVREGPRLVGRTVLTENEVRLGYSGQQNAERCIALADHALDVHGEGYLCRELSEPYGIPYECLLPKEYANLIVPCRGASFTHIAAASCRTTRTMMQLGNAAGVAAAVALQTDSALPDVDLGRVRRELGFQ